MIQIFIDSYEFRIYPEMSYVKLVNPSDKSDFNYSAKYEPQYVAFFFNEIDKEIKILSPALKKYPFKKALDKYRKLKAFV